MITYLAEDDQQAGLAASTVANNDQLAAQFRHGSVLMEAVRGRQCGLPGPIQRVRGLRPLVGSLNAARACIDSISRVLHVALASHFQVLGRLGRKADTTSYTCTQTRNLRFGERSPQHAWLYYSG